MLLKNEENINIIGFQIIKLISLTYKKCKLLYYYTFYKLNFEHVIV